MQLRTAAQTMGFNANQMSISELRALSQCLEKYTCNIKLTAMHLRQLADYDKLPVKLGMNDVKIIGSRYNRGTNPSMESLKKDMSYGEFIVKNWEHFHRLVW